MSWRSALDELRLPARCDPAVRALVRDSPVIGQSGYPDNLAGQDHREIKRRVRPVPGFKQSSCAFVLSVAPNAGDRQTAVEACSPTSSVNRRPILLVVIVSNTRHIPFVLCALLTAKKRSRGGIQFGRSAMDDIERGRVSSAGHGIVDTRMPAGNRRIRRPGRHRRSRVRRMSAVGMLPFRPPGTRRERVARRRR
jgi:hypothetical protein